MASTNASSSSSSSSAPRRGPHHKEAGGREREAGAAIRDRYPLHLQARLPLSAQPPADQAPSKFVVIIFFFICFVFIDTELAQYRHQHLRFFFGAIF